MQSLLVYCVTLQKEYKGRTDNSSPPGFNEAVRVTILYNHIIYLIETEGQQSGRFLPNSPSLQPTLAGRSSDTM